jgi:hypothetical protein
MMRTLFALALPLFVGLRGDAQIGAHRLEALGKALRQLGRVLGEVRRRVAESQSSHGAPLGLLGIGYCGEKILKLKRIYSS